MKFLEPWIVFEAAVSPGPRDDDLTKLRTAVAPHTKEALNLKLFCNQSRLQWREQLATVDGENARWRGLYTRSYPGLRAFVLATKGAILIWSPQNLRIFWPLPPCHVQNTLNLSPFVCFLGIPLPPPTADVIYGSPQTKLRRIRPDQNANPLLTLRH